MDIFDTKTVKTLKPEVLTKLTNSHTLLTQYADLGYYGDKKVSFDKTLDLYLSGTYGYDYIISTACEGLTMYTTVKGLQNTVGVTLELDTAVVDSSKLIEYLTLHLLDDFKGSTLKIFRGVYCQTEPKLEIVIKGLDTALKNHKNLLTLVRSILETNNE